MVEREDIIHIPYDSEDLREEMSRVDSLDKFRFLLKETLPDVPVNAFVYDFAAQIDLHELFAAYGHKTKIDKETPVLILKHPGETNAGTKTIGGTSSIEPYRFRLRDKDHIYYFSKEQREEPLEVRFADTVTQVFPAVKHNVSPLNRVPINGGESQGYDYRHSLWQPNSHGIFRGVGIGNGRMGDLRLPRVYGPTSSQ